MVATSGDDGVRAGAQTGASTSSFGRAFLVEQVDRDEASGRRSPHNIQALAIVLASNPQNVWPNIVGRFKRFELAPGKLWLDAIQKT